MSNQQTNAGTPLHVAPPTHNNQAQFYNAAQNPGVQERPTPDAMPQNIGKYELMLMFYVRVTPWCLCRQQLSCVASHAAKRLQQLAESECGHEQWFRVGQSAYGHDGTDVHRSWRYLDRFEHPDLHPVDAATRTEGPPQQLL